MRGEPHVVRRRDHHVGDDPALEAAHPVGEHDLRDPAEGLEALSEQPHRGVGALVVGEADEPHPRERQHRAEHVQPVQHPSR